jgi:hypothetical protein
VFGLEPVAEDAALRLERGDAFAAGKDVAEEFAEAVCILITR